MSRPIPDWFTLCERATPEIMKRIAASAASSSMPLQVKGLALQSHWFILDSLLLANQANRDGMHANALALTRQCLEAIFVLEVALCGHEDSGSVLIAWDSDRLRPGDVRKWLAENVWHGYGAGLWSEPWTDFISKLSRAVQPYAHYSSQLAKWQLRLHGQIPSSESCDELTLLVEYSPRAYDAQKATRITLFHGIISYALARIWIASSKEHDGDFALLIDQLRNALGRSSYLDGHQTDWDQQFWAMVWSREGGTILE